MVTDIKTFHLEVVTVTVLILHFLTDFLFSQSNMKKKRRALIVLCSVLLPLQRLQTNFLLQISLERADLGQFIR